MTTGNMLYLLMCLAMFGALSASLAFYSSETANASRRKQPAATVQSDTKAAVTD
jgi:hypothetical protein